MVVPFKWLLFSLWQQPFRSILFLLCCHRFYHSNIFRDLTNTIHCDFILRVFRHFATYFLFILNLRDTMCTNSNIFHTHDIISDLFLLYSQLNICTYFVSCILKLCCFQIDIFSHCYLNMNSKMRYKGVWIPLRRIEWSNQFVNFKMLLFRSMEYRETAICKLNWKYHS